MLSLIEYINRQKETQKQKLFRERPNRQNTRFLTVFERKFCRTAYEGLGYWRSR